MAHRSNHPASNRSVILAVLCAGVAASIAAPCFAGAAVGIPIAPNTAGITFSQVDFEFTDAPLADSNTAEISINAAALLGANSFSSGYLNVTTYSSAIGGSGTWAVQNLPINLGDPYGGLRTNLELPIAPGTDTNQVNAYVEFSPTPNPFFVGGAQGGWGVDGISYNARGKISLLPQPPAPAIPPGGRLVTFPAGGLTGPRFLQINYPNVQTADNQCGPMAVANGLEYLHSARNLAVPHVHAPGLGSDTTNQRLVSQLDRQMGRNSVSRASGSTLDDYNVVEGTLFYLTSTDVQLKIPVEHMDDDFGDSDVSLGGLTSVGRGKAPSASFIFDKLSKNWAVELGYTGKGGGHWVSVIEYSTILGVPAIRYTSDHDQTSSDATDSKGTDGRPDFSFLVDTDGDGLLNLVNEKGWRLSAANGPNVDVLIAFAVPEPVTLASALLLLPLARRRRSQV